MKKLVKILLFIGSFTLISCGGGGGIKNNLPKDAVQGEALQGFDDIFYSKKFKVNENLSDGARGTYNFRMATGEVLKYEEYSGGILESRQKIYNYALSSDKKTLYLQLKKDAVNTKAIVNIDEEGNKKAGQNYELLTYSEREKFTKSAENVKLWNTISKEDLERNSEYRMYYIAQMGLKGNASNEEVAKEAAKNINKVEVATLTLKKKEFSRVLAFSINKVKIEGKTYIELKEKFSIPSLDTFTFMDGFQGNLKEDEAEIGKNTMQVIIEGDTCGGFIYLYHTDKGKTDWSSEVNYQLVDADKEHILFVNNCNVEDRITGKYLATADYMTLNITFPDVYDKKTTYNASITLNRAFNLVKDYILYLEESEE